jgi:RNase P/RNase MRP subunit p29
MKKNFTYNLIAAACVSLLATGCGGGGSESASPISTPPTSNASPTTTSGIVTGFGSVIVDGIRINNHAVNSEVEREDGSVVSKELKLGQHVEIEHDDNMTASKVRVINSVEGSVELVDINTSTLKINGQTIKINTDAALGPVTVFEAPYTNLADINVNERVEVHGITKVDASGMTYTQASRVEKIVLDNTSRVHGVVKTLSLQNKTFVLGDLTIDFSTAKLLPAGAVIQEGNEVHVAIPLGTVKSGQTVKAEVIKVTDHKKDDHDKKVELGGSISNIDANAKTMVVNSVTVDFSAATFDPLAKTANDLKQNLYVVVKGVYNNNGILIASKITLRDSQTKTDSTELHGTILNYVSNENFTVRDVHVDAGKATIDTTSCGSTKLSNNLQVEIHGNVSATGIVNATSVKCEKTEQNYSVIGRSGKVGQLNNTAKTFVLTTEKELVKVLWTNTTLLVDGEFTTLEGKNVEVEGVLNTDGFLVASKIKVRN